MPEPGWQRSAPGLIASRRQFLGWAGAGTIAVLAGPDLLAGPALGMPRLSARNSTRIERGVQHFVSRPDLNPPEVLIETKMKGSLGGLVVTDCHGGPSQSGPLVIDQSGRIVWFDPLSPKPSAAHRAFNVRPQTYGGKPVLTWFQGAVDGDHGAGYYEIFDTSYQQVAQVHAAGGYVGDLHEFLLTDRGTALFTCYGSAETRARVAGSVRTVPYTYGVVQEVDVATGKLLFQWRSDHHIPLSDSYYRPSAKPGSVWDYFHVNAISIDPSDQNLIISGRNTWACYKVNRRTGDVIWRLGGKRSEFELGPGTRFAFQHDVNMHPDGVMTVFDNEGGPPKVAPQSKALVLSVNERTRRVSLKHSYAHHPSVYSDALGSVQPLSADRYLVGWGRATYFTVYESGGKILFDGRLTPGANSYRAFLGAWSAMPTRPPDVAVTRAGTTATVYASWNGATEVASWGVLGGSAPGSLAELGAAAVEGFETAITVPDAPAYLAVCGYGGGGQVLGTSSAIAG